MVLWYPKVRSSSRRIVEVPDVDASGGRGGLVACVDAGTDPLGAEEALWYGVVSATSFSTHARVKPKRSSSARSLRSRRGFRGRSCPLPRGGRGDGSAKGRRALGTGGFDGARGPSDEMARLELQDDREKESRALRVDVGREHESSSRLLETPSTRHIGLRGNATSGALMNAYFKHSPARARWPLARELSSAFRSDKSSDVWQEHIPWDVGPCRRLVLPDTDRARQHCKTFRAPTDGNERRSHGSRPWVPRTIRVLPSLGE